MNEYYYYMATRDGIESTVFFVENKDIRKRSMIGAIKADNLSHWFLKISTAWNFASRWQIVSEPLAKFHTSTTTFR